MTTSLLGPAAPEPATDAATAVSAPFVPFAMPETMSPQARHEWRQTVNAGTQDALEAWGRKWAPQNVAGSPGEVSAPVADPAAAVDPALSPVAAKLEEHGSSLEVLTSLAGPLAKFHEHLASLDEAGLELAISEGEDAVLARYYKGSETRMAAGLRDIEAAAKLIGLDLDDINDSGVLADPDLHMRAHLMANNILRGKPTP